MNIYVFDCLVCGKPIIGKRADAVYCSTICGNKSRNRTYSKKHHKELQQKRLVYNSDLERKMYQRVKSRAKINNIPFNLERGDIIIPKYCPILNIELSSKKNVGSGYHDNSPSLDRIKPELGYVKGNIRVISFRANLLKSNATVEELTKVLEDLKYLESL